MSSKPYMQLWIGDLLSDTMGLTSQEFGCYMLLLCALWSEERAISPDRLHVICRMSRDQWSRGPKKALEIYFVVDEAGAWFNPRLDRELAEFHSKAIGRQSKARKAAAVRWGTDSEHSSDANQ